MKAALTNWLAAYAACEEAKRNYLNLTRDTRAFNKPTQRSARERASCLMSNDRIELEPGDFHLAVRRRAHLETPWRWEIWAAGQTKAVRHSKRRFVTIAEAMKEGKVALKAFLSQQFPSAT